MRSLIRENGIYSKIIRKTFELGNTPVKEDLICFSHWLTDFSEPPYVGRYEETTGAKPRRRQFSVITRGTKKFCRYSKPPALVPPPDILKPPNGWRSTIAPVIVRLI